MTLNKPRAAGAACAALILALALAPFASADHTCDDTEPEELREWCEAHDGPLGIHYPLGVGRGGANVELPCPIFDYDCWNCWIQVFLGAWRVCD